MQQWRGAVHDDRDKHKPDLHHCFFGRTDNHIRYAIAIYISNSNGGTKAIARLVVCPEKDCPIS
jgi:hypothetical protein